MDTKYLQTAAILLPSLLGIGVEAQTSSTEVELAATIYFRQDWCPFSTEIGNLKENFDLTMSGCCIFKVTQRNGDRSIAERTVEQFREHITPGQDLGACIGENIETVATRLKAGKEQETLRARQADLERKELPPRLRTIDTKELCVGAGNILRRNRVADYAPILGDMALPLILSELKRRGIALLTARVRAGEFRIGDPECQLYAAWGLPVSSNRTGSPNSINTQHVYGHRAYVYTENGRISAWQD